MGEPKLPATKKMVKCFEYLDQLRESGITNMYGARPFLEEAMNLKSDSAGVILRKWMQTFSHEKTPAERAKDAFGLQP